MSYTVTQSLNLPNQGDAGTERRKISTPRLCTPPVSSVRNEETDSHLVLRGVVAGDGHKTTVKLEPAFWDMLLKICSLEKKNLDVLVQEVDDMRGQSPRASALRVYALRYFTASLSQRTPERPFRRIRSGDERPNSLTLGSSNGLSINSGGQFEIVGFSDIKKTTYTNPPKE